MQLCEPVEERSPSRKAVELSERTETLLGLSLVPEANAWRQLAEAAGSADEAGLDLIGIQDHPYQWRFLDTFAFIASLLANTRHIRIFPDVANLPLRPPSVLAKTAASLDLLSGGRFELGLGAGAFWEAVQAMGGPRRTAREAVDALAEAIEVIRLMWSGERAVSYPGHYYQLKGVHPGAPPPHEIEIWVGAYKPRMLQLVGRLADGWIPSLGRISPEELHSAHAVIDDAAEAAGRSPLSIRRLLNIGGTITTGGRGDLRPARSVGRLSSDLSGPPEFWHDMLSGLKEIGFSAFIFWFPEEEHTQIARLAEEVAPLVRDASS
jgi:alkanesulfonate monooxygenase SsuD/methylene tetrahydromethanopterin reductase-like flavin-dependent oxidoreductase (luciferase family)